MPIRFSSLNQFQLSKLNHQAIGEIILTIYCTCFSAISFSHLLLACLYFILKGSNCNENGELVNAQNSTSLLKIIQRAMVYVGQIHRQEALSGVLHHSVLFASVMNLYLIKKLSNGKLLAEGCDDGFVKFLNKTDEVCEQISKEFDQCLGQLIESSLVFNRVILRGNDECLEEEEHNIISTKMTLSDYLERKKTFRAPWNSNKPLLNFKNAQNSPSFNDKINFSRSVIAEFSTQQIHHLTKLAFSKEKVWPSNRTNAWASKFKMITIVCFNLSSILGWLIGEVASLLMIHRAYNHINQQTKLGEAFGLADRLVSVNHILYTYFATSWFVATLLIPVLDAVDQIKETNSFEPRLNKLRYKVQQLHQVQDIIDSGRHYTELNNLKLIRNGLKFECDHEAIEFYVSYHLFRNNIKGTIELAQSYLTRNITFGLLVILPPIGLYKYEALKCSDLSSSEQTIPLLVSFAGIVFVACNIFLWIGSYLNGSCVRLYKCIWPIVAMAEEYTSTHYASNQQSQSTLEDDLSQERPPEISSHEYYSASPIAPHTVMLYRRLIYNESHIMDNSVVKLQLYNSFKVNYTGLVKFNFWIISFILLICSR